MEVKTVRDLTLEELNREYVYTKRRSREMYAKEKELEAELERRFEKGELKEEGVVE